MKGLHSPDDCFVIGWYNEVAVRIKVLQREFDRHYNVYGLNFIIR